VLSVTPVRVGRLGFDIATLLYAAALTMLGHALLWFAAISERFAGRIGLGERPAAAPWWSRWRLERGLASAHCWSPDRVSHSRSLAAALAGGRLRRGRPDDTVRIVVPAVLGLVLGVQTIFSSLLLSVMELPTRSHLLLSAPRTHARSGA
jgi:hypothetical protein